MNLRSYINPHLQQSHSKSGNVFALTVENELLSFLKKFQFINLLRSFLNRMVHLGLKNQINTWTVTYSLDLTLAQPSPSCSKNVCYFKKKSMRSSRHICEDQQQRNKSEREQHEVLGLLTMLLFSKQRNLEHKAPLSQQVMSWFFFPFPLSLIITFSLFLIFHLQNRRTDRL